MSKFLLALVMLQERLVYYNLDGTPDQGKLSRKTLLMAVDYLISAASLPHCKAGYDRLCEILDPDLRWFLIALRDARVIASLSLQQELAVYSAFKQVVINFYDDL